MSNEDIRALLTDYSELNPSVIDELDAAPTPLQFSRYVARNRPFVVRGAAANWTAARRWNASYLREKLVDRKVCVAITPNGEADAIVQHKDGTLVLARPYESFLEFDELLTRVQADSSINPEKQTYKNVFYSQTQNNNLRGEYASISSDVPAEIDFARTALDRDADAVNFWLGNQCSVTALHKDNYENIYVQVRGMKHFVLLPPIAVAAVNERLVKVGGYRPGSTFVNESDGELKLEVDPLQSEVPAPIWDPDHPEMRSTAYSGLVTPSRVSLDENDMLYLPAMWYHKVYQSVGKEGFALAVNYWYDMDFDGGFWALNAFTKGVVQHARTGVAYPALKIGDEES